MINTNTLWLEQPAADWNEALPVGNGRLGAMIFGGVGRERLQLNEDTLWSGEPVQPADADLWTHLETVRQLVFGRQYAEATEAARQMQGAFTESYLPLGDLVLDFEHGDEAISDYRRELDLETATVQISYRAGEVAYRRTIFASAPDQALVVHLTADQPGCLSLGVSLTSLLRSATESAGSETLRLTGQAPAHVEPDYRDIEPAIVYEDAETGRGMRFTAFVRAVADGGSVQPDLSTLTIMQADSVTLYLTAATSFNGFDRSPSRDGKDHAAIAKTMLDAVASEPFAAIYDAHLADYQPYFRRVTLDLGDPETKSDLPTDKRLLALQRDDGQDHVTDNALTALYFQYGRYLLISASRSGTQPANLQGIWNSEMRPAWSCNFTININTQMNYWPSEVTNLADLSEPLFDLIDALCVTGRDAASSYYNAGGWCAHHNTDLWARANPVGEKTGSPCWANWPMGGAWLVQHLWEHYAFSGDRAFLAERAYPAIKGTAEFLLDFLVESPDGFLVTCPSVSPENEFQYTATDSSQTVGHVTAATTADLAIVREVLHNTVESARILGIDADFAARAADALTRLPPYEIGEAGELQEWSADVSELDLGHRHISHLYANYPGMTITEDSAPELAQAVRRSLDRRVEAGGGYTGWSRAWLINQYARLGEAEKAYHSVHVLLAESTYPTLLDVHPPFQIDGNFGGTSGIAEMLLQSQNHYVDLAGPHENHYLIELLPALPTAWPTGLVTGLRARGGFEVSEAWVNGRLSHATIRSVGGRACRVRYGETAIELKLEPGKSVRLDRALNASSID